MSMRSIEEHRKLVCVFVAVDVYKNKTKLFSLFDRCCTQCQWHFFWFWCECVCMPVCILLVLFYFYFAFAVCVCILVRSNIIYSQTIAWKCVNRERNVWCSGSPYYIHFCCCCYSSLLCLVLYCFILFYPNVKVRNEREKKRNRHRERAMYQASTHRIAVVNFIFIFSFFRNGIEFILLTFISQKISVYFSLNNLLYKRQWWFSPIMFM